MENCGQAGLEGGVEAGVICCRGLEAAEMRPGARGGAGGGDTTGAAAGGATGAGCATEVPGVGG